MMLSRSVGQRVLQSRTMCKGLRSPLPPTACCKRNRGGHKLFTSNASTKDASPQRRGGILIGLGWALLGLVTVDQLLQYKQEREAEERRRLLYLMQEEANEENEAEWDSSLPILFECKIVHTEAMLDGTKMLRNIGVGDVVEVLEAGIGPNKAYHLCRNPSSDRPGSTGWYPIEFMERID
jgi:hypothetical protein